MRCKKHTALPKRWLKSLLTVSVAVLGAMVILTASAYATFLDHWAGSSDVRVEQLLSERMSSGLYDIEQGGQIDLALYYAVRGQTPQTQNLNDLPNLKQYIDAPLAEPLKADIYVALTHEIMRRSDFAALVDLRRSYTRGVQSNLRAYADAHAQTVVLENLGLFEAADAALLALVENPTFQNLSHYARDRPDNFRRLSEIALARGETGLAVSRAQKASLSYQSYLASVKTEPTKTAGMQVKIDLTLARAFASSGQVELALPYAQSAFSLAQASGNKRLEAQAQLIQAEAALQTDPIKAAQLLHELTVAANFDAVSPQSLRVYDGLTRAQQVVVDKAAVQTARLADIVRQSLLETQTMRQAAYFASQKLVGEPYAAQDAGVEPAVMSEKPKAAQSSWASKTAAAIHTNQLSWLGLGLAFFGILLALIAQVRVRRSRRALHVYAQNLERSEKTARENARAAKENMCLAQVSDAAKTAFLANMSHEIRTPMNGVLGMADVLRRTTNLDRRQSEIVEAIHTSGTSLMTVLGDILDFSKIDSETLELNVAEANLRESVEAVATLMSAQAREKGLEILMRYSPNAPENLNVDIGRLRQILLNLVGNAIKFTQQGHVLINVDIEMEENVAHTQIDVLDTGIGISQANQDIVFDDFVQADQGRNKRYGGTGLGLSISKKIVEAMGGEISLRSREGEGSVVTFRLPLTLSGDQSVVRLEHFKNERILLIDNNAASLKIISAQLKAWGLSNTVARKSKDGITGLLRAKELSDPYAAIIIDQRCVDGSDFFIDALKSNPSIAHTPVILLSDVTGYTTTSDNRYSVQVSKPIVGQKLFKALEAVLQNTNETKKSGQVETVAKATTCPIVVSPVPARQVKRVLLAENSAATRKVIAAFLEDSSVQLHSVDDGEEALEIAKTIDFDIIFMDAQLRKLDGFLATRAIRGHEKNTHSIRTPIICLSPFALGADQDLATAVGMDDFLVKPLSPTKLDQIMIKWGGIKSDIRKTKAAKSTGQTAKIDPIVQSQQKKKRSTAA